MMHLATHCDIRIPAESLYAILGRLSFQRLSGGRKPGEENKFHKYRSGTHGGWTKYFDDKLTATFRSVAGDLTAALGYDG
jgi:hypothetical protein